MRAPALLLATLGLAILAPGLLTAPSALAQTVHSHEHSFEGAETWSKIFDDPARDAWQKPHEVIQALGLKPNAAVADIGSGTGYFSVRIAHMLPAGKVYGVDTEPDMVRYLADRAAREGIRNIVAIPAAAGDPRLPEKVDLIVMVDVFHHITDRERYFRALGTYLKPGGRIAIIDFRPDAADTADGPPRSARIAPAQVRRELQRAGYALATEHRFLPNQYFLVFTPAAG